MILIDASVWIDHMRRAEPRLQRLMSDRQLLMHPYAIGEIMLGSIANRAAVSTTLRYLPQAPVALHEEILSLIERERLHGMGIGYVDAISWPRQSWPAQRSGPATSGSTSQPIALDCAPASNAVTDEGRSDQPLEPEQWPTRRRLPVLNWSNKKSHCLTVL